MPFRSPPSVFFEVIISCASIQILIPLMHILYHFSESNISACLKNHKNTQKLHLITGHIINIEIKKKEAIIQSKKARKLNYITTVIISQTSVSQIQILLKQC